MSIFGREAIRDSAALNFHAMLLCFLVRFDFWPVSDHQPSHNLETEPLVSYFQLQGYLLLVVIVTSIVLTLHKIDAKRKPKVVWSANRNNLVTIDALLEFAENGDLALNEPDEKNVVWFNGTMGKCVVGINLTYFGNLVLFDDSNATDGSLDHPTDTLVSVDYNRLNSSGHLRAYRYDDMGGFINMGDMLPLETYLMFCCPYGICSNGRCDCPPPSGGVAYFNPVKYLQPKLGCVANVPLACDDQGFQHFMEIKGLYYFDFVTDVAGFDAKGCSDACSRKCSCKAALFRRSVSSLNGECFLPTDLLSPAKARHHELSLCQNYTVYFKVQVQGIPCS
ncbi:hypothetical protein MLD38_033296 [Melastoma candidum]|uniref:Uncharacterized protein n=1 Tax=Melastoma candidum TaxID=119954 RepID=A0ACB9M6V1_9MYRT|nr:hypothetical protein MLD38_033296 [Melastoma candidum]